jgi:hypothetical protein
MDQGKVSRRRILRALGVLLPLQHASSALSNALPCKADGDRLVGLFTRQTSAAAIGDLYLASRGDRPDVDKLMEEFVRLDPSPGTILNELTESELRLHVQGRIAQDFSTGQTTRVNGWVFANSELLLYALVSISS